LIAPANWVPSSPHDAAPQRLVAAPAARRARRPVARRRAGAAQCGGERGSGAGAAVFPRRRGAARGHGGAGGAGGRRGGGGGGGGGEVRAGRRVQGARGNARAAGGHRAPRRGQLRRLLQRRLRRVAVPLHPRRPQGGELPPTLC